MNTFLKALEPNYIANDLLKPKEILFRYDSPISRYYYRFVEEEEFPYMGVTGVANRLLPKGEGIFNWYAQNGNLARLQLHLLGEYGTLLHTEIGLFERNSRKVNFGEVEEFAVQYARSNGCEIEAENWAYHLPRNLASWIQFVNEKKVDVLAVEYPIWSDKYHIATLVDVYCEMDFNRKRVRAIINIKKGAIEGKLDENKTFYESHDLQLQLEKKIWNECMNKNAYAPPLANSPVDMVFNWSPNNWTKEPTYTLKNWSEKTDWPDERLNDYLPLLKWEFNPPKKSIILSGEYTPEKSLADCIKEVRMNKTIAVNKADAELTEQLKASVAKETPKPVDSEELAFLRPKKKKTI